MVEYVKLEDRGLFQPERRHTQLPLPGGRIDRRHGGVDHVRATSEQYEFLRDCLVRREKLKAQVGARERMLRHVLVSIAIVFVAVYFAAPDFRITFGALGLTQAISLLQISAIAPLMIAYLIVHACHLGASHLRLVHECRILDAELERFGGPTSYSVLRAFKRQCEKDKATWGELLSRKMYHLVYLAHAALLMTSVILALAGATYVAVAAYADVYPRNPHVAIGFYLYLLVALLASAAAPTALWYVKNHKTKLLDRYLDEFGPPGPWGGVRVNAAGLGGGGRA